MTRRAAHSVKSVCENSTRFRTVAPPDIAQSKPRPRWAKRHYQRRRRALYHPLTQNFASLSHRCPRRHFLSPACGSCRGWRERTRQPSSSLRNGALSPALSTLSNSREPQQLGRALKILTSATRLSVVPSTLSTQVLSRVKPGLRPRA